MTMTVRAIAYLIVRDEATVLEELVSHHRREGLEIVAIDNGSGDATAALLEKLHVDGAVLAWESRPTETYAWEALVTAGVALAERFVPDWIVHLDANTFLESADAPERRLVDDIEDAEKAGCNVVTLRVFDFYPAPDDARGESSVYRRVRHYTPRAKLSRIQEKIFRYYPGLSVTDGHSITFPPGVEKRVSPASSVMRHYVFRDSRQGVQKLLCRKNRWNESERQRGSHVHYDGYLGYSAETTMPARHLHRKDDGMAWQTEVMHERPESLLSEHHDFNSSGWFDRACQENTHLCFIIGCQRSGTTLLRLVFDSHPEVAAFEEPKSYDYWADRDLLARTVQDGRAANKRLFVFKTPCLTEQFDSPDQVAKELRYRVFPFRFAYEGQLLVFTVRDPRDVCLSLRKLKARSSGGDWIDHWPRYVDELYPRIIPDFATRFAHELEIIANSGACKFAAQAALYWKIKTDPFFRYDALGYKLRLLVYEDLVTRPEWTLRQLCRFLGIGFDPHMIAHDQQPHTDVGANGLTVGDTDPQRKIDSTATRLYCGVMPIEEQQVILEIAGDTYARIQRKWEQQLRNDLVSDLPPTSLPNGSAGVVEASLGKSVPATFSWRSASHRVISALRRQAEV